MRTESATDSDPEIAIATAKEVLEAVCRTILSELGITFDKDDNVPKLVRMMVDKLKLVPDELVKAKEAAENVNVLLSKEKSNDTRRVDFFVVPLCYGRHP